MRLLGRKRGVHALGCCPLTCFFQHPQLNVWRTEGGLIPILPIHSTGQRGGENESYARRGVGCPLAYHQKRGLWVKESALAMRLHQRPRCAREKAALCGHGKMEWSRILLAGPKRCPVTCTTYAEYGNGWEMHSWVNHAQNLGLHFCAAYLWLLIRVIHK